ncbi:MAG: Ig-like domain-containing protein [Cyclobacteriaceae bacterium]|nr:Ig-like domain-containing protein [Cyclobacteriaceae bacterium]
MNDIRFLLVAVLCWACASQTQPTGGPRDKTPPKLISSSPAPNQKNFKGTSVELAFDEYVKLKDPKDEILISPSMGKDVNYVARKNKVIITPKRPWRDSTTYSISFRDGVQDITESNPADNLRLAFSTGNEIDSLRISGKLKDALRTKIPAGYTVAVYTADTFDIFRHTPSYFSRSTKKGTFSIENLKAGNYYIYAFEDRNKNLKVDSRNEPFGFLLDPISVNGKTDSVTIYQVRVDSRPLRINSIRHYQDRSVVRFSRHLQSYRFAQPDTLLHGFGEQSDVIEIFHRLPTADSIPLKFHATDSVEQTLDSTLYIKTGKSRFPVTSVKLTTEKVTLPTETRELLIVLNSNSIIRHLKLDSVGVKRDTTAFKPLTAENIEASPDHKTIAFRAKLDTAFLKKKSSKLQLYLPKGFIETGDYEKSPRFEVPINPIAPEATGTLLTDIKTKEKNYVVELLSSDGKVIASQRNITRYTFRNLPAGDYQLRVLVDSNENGRWDPGSFPKRTPTERVIYYYNLDGKTIFPIRAAWEVGPFVISF